MAEEVYTSLEEKASYYRGAIKKIVAERGHPIYLAVVDDEVNGPFSESPMLEDLLTCIPLELKVSHRMDDKDADVIIQEIGSAKLFIERAEEFDVCILDGNFGDNLSGPQAVPLIRSRNQSIRIIGRSGENKYNQQFRKLKVDEVIPKDPRTGSIPQNLEFFLDVLLSIGERSYQDPSKMSLEELIRTQ